MKRVPLPDPGLTSALTGLLIATAGTLSMLGRPEALPVSLLAGLSGLVGAAGIASLRPPAPGFAAAAGLLFSILYPVAGEPAALVSSLLYSIGALGLAARRRFSGAEYAALGLAMALAGGAAKYLVGAPEYALLRDLALVSGLSIAISSLTLRESLKRG